MYTLVLALYVVGGVVLPQRRMGLGVQFSTTEIYRPDQGFIQPAKLNATIIEEQIDRFLNDGKKPPLHREIRPDIVGLQAAKANQLPQSEDIDTNMQTSPPIQPSSPPIPQETPSTPIETVPLETNLGLLQETGSEEEISERNSLSFMVLCMLGVGLIITLGGLYYKGAVAF